MQTTTAYLKRAPIIPARPLIPGRKGPTFPPYFRVEERPVTFREADGLRSREEREEYCIDWIARARKLRRLTVVLIPYDIYYSRKISIFLAGWTLLEHEGEVRTHQCVAFLRDDAVPVGRSDQGVLCVARRRALAAWNGREEDASRGQVA